MSRNNGRDYLYLVWKDYKSRQRYIIGELSRNGKYEFKYLEDGLNKAIENGFEPLIAFTNTNEVYNNYEMFPAFSSRLPDKRRRDVKEILEKYNLEKYDAFDLLKNGGGKLPTDSLEFIDPIFLEDSNIIREFYIAGVGHYDFCDNKKNEKNISIEKSEELKLIKDSNNNHDKYAIKIEGKNSYTIGYIPVFFSKAVFDALDDKRNMKCIVINKECNNLCEECIKVRLIIE